jgi:hypothetical protein
MNLHSEIPPRQGSHHEFQSRDYGRFAFALERILGSHKPDSVETAIDLYCGTGSMTAGAVTLFNCEVHAVDYHPDTLVPSLRVDRRVIFHRGWVSEELMSGNLPEADLITISFASRHYGLEAVHFGSLRRLARGVLVTIGDNGGMEAHPAFRQNFRVIRNDHDHDAQVWVHSAL